MSKKYKTIYLDWDGVLWNFKNAFCAWHDLDVPYSTEWEFYEMLGMDADEFHRKLSKLPVEFWQHEEFLFDHAQSLVNWAKENAEHVKILTVDGGDNACLRGKTKLAMRLGVKGFNTIGVDGSADKRLYAAMGSLLIDDRAETVKDFREAGGHALIWSADYNQGHGRMYFNAGLLKVEKPVVEKKEPLDYDSMDEAKRRKMTPMYSGCLAYFPDALAMVAQNSMVGHVQHNDPSEPMYWDRTKSADELDAMIRHMADHSKNPYDTDGRLHMSKVAWRALAFVQKFIEKENENE